MTTQPITIDQLGLALDSYPHSNAKALIRIDISKSVDDLMNRCGDLNDTEREFFRNHIVAALPKTYCLTGEILNNVEQNPTAVFLEVKALEYK